MRPWLLRQTTSWLPLRALLYALAWTAGLGTAIAQESGRPAVERRRIAEQQTQARALFAQEERECQVRFAVTACVDEARKRHRDAMAALSRQSAVLDDTERRQRAALRAQAIRDRISTEATRQRLPNAAVREPRSSSSRVPAETRGNSSVTSKSAESSSGSLDPQREVREARSRTTFQARQTAAKEHREAAERRAAQRQKNRSPAAPLPTPPAPTR